jgi:hypothetical protein
MVHQLTMNNLINMTLNFDTLQKILPIKIAFVDKELCYKLSLNPKQAYIIKILNS